ncbi:MAG: M16 family metallopeptidase [Polaromonas sp.]
MKKLLIALCWLVSAATALAQGDLKEIRRVEGITEYALPNGLTVLLAPDPSKPTTTVNLTYRVGSRHEGYGESGAAHLLEHLLFKATAHIADPKLELSRRGARWNGTTGFDRTNYFAQFASNDETQNWVVGWLAEAMTQAKVAKADLDTEMTVVRNELEQAESNPGHTLGAKMRSAAYQWHGYGRDVLGARSDLENMPIERLQAFYRKHYRPDNAVLVIGGKFDEAAALRQVAQAFGPIPKPAIPIEATWTLEPTQDGERHVSLRRVGGLSSVAVMYHVMPSNTPDFAAVRVLAQLLSNDRSPLGKGWVGTGLAVTHWAGASTTLEPALLMAGASLPETADVEQNAVKASTALANILETLALSEPQVRTARAQVLQSLQSMLRNPEALSLALSESVALGDWRLWFAMRDWVEAVTLADVQRVASTYLLPSNRTSGSYIAVAQQPVRAPAPVLTDVAQLLKDYTGKAAVAAVEDFTPTPENIEARVVNSRITVGDEPGLRLAVLPRKTKEDRVTGTLRLRWGSADTVNGSAVLATMLAPLMTQGTRNKDADRVAQALLALEAQLRFTSLAGGLNANFEVPARHLPAFTALLAELLQESTFSDAAFERNRKAMIAVIQAVKADTGVVAGNGLQRVFSRYGAGDPRQARTLGETEALMRSATSVQLREFWSRFAGASVGEMALIGPVHPDEARALLQKHFGGWKSKEPRKGWVFEYPATLEPRWQSVKLPDKANASYAARIPVAMNDESPDFPALFAAVQLLGGRAGTALWQRVREQEGLSYGVNAALFVPAAPQGEGNAAGIDITASFAPQNRDRLRNVIRDELAKRAANGFSSLEVSFSRRAIVSGRADFLAQTANLAGVLANNLRWGHDMARYARFTQAYATLDADAVNAALRKYLDVSQLVEVSAGSFAD